jgi:hypothetical protein
MTSNKTIGTLFIAGAIAVFIPYIALTIIFEYPDILRQGTSTVLRKFHDGGSTLIWTWFAFAVAGIPLLPAYILLGQKLEQKAQWIRVATNLGVIGLIVQMIGLLRWTFVVPVLAESFVNATDPATKSAAIIAFKTIHQFGGVILGEHLGQFFTIAWTVMISISSAKLNIFSKSIRWLGYSSSFIYLLAQTELFATVIPGFPVWDMAGFIGSSLWLLWLILIGIALIRNKDLPLEKQV